ncbi:MAG: zwf [Pseudonocardiales bacterium]|nr:zwf [Pseudonocardiales bacterium]
MPARRTSLEGPGPGPTGFVLFGATGDLAKRMVLPAFYQLAIEDLLPEDGLPVGNDRGCEWDQHT